MADQQRPDFGKRRQVSVPPSQQQPSKRSNQVALLVMGTLAVGGTAYALMPRECAPTTPTATPGISTPSECPSRGSSSGSYGGSSRYSYYSGGSSSSTPAATSDAGSGGVRRGGFGAFFSSHFSFGG